MCQEQRREHGPEPWRAGHSEGERVTLLQRTLPPLLGSAAPLVGCHLIQLQGFDFDPQSLLAHGFSQKDAITWEKVDLSVYLCGYLGFRVTLEKLDFAHVTRERGFEAWERCKQSLLGTRQDRSSWV